MRKTIKNVMMVVPVLMTSCQVSLNRNSGPVTSQARITPTARLKVAGLPVTRAVALARRVNRDRDFVGRITVLSVPSLRFSDCPPQLTGRDDKIQRLHPGGATRLQGQR